MHTQSRNPLPTRHRINERGNHKQTESSRSVTSLKQRQVRRRREGGWKEEGRTENSSGQQHSPQQTNSSRQSRNNGTHEQWKNNGTHEQRNMERTNEQWNERTSTTTSIDRWKDGLSLSLSVEWSGVEWVRGPSKPTHHTSQPTNQPANQPASEARLLQCCSVAAATHLQPLTSPLTHSLTHPLYQFVGVRSFLPSGQTHRKKLGSLRVSKCVYE